jgi:CDP-glycerol glycerophosphotransferase (TagB/SpsB family)
MSVELKHFKKIEKLVDQYMSKRIFISADHGLALIYFLQSDLIRTLLDHGIEIIMLTDDGARAAIEERFKQKGIIFEGLRLNLCKQYSETVASRRQRWLYVLRWVGGSKRVNVKAIDGNYHLITRGIEGHTRFMIPIINVIVWLMRRFKLIRRMIVDYQNRFTPEIYSDLFDKYQPDLVLASSPGWRMDRYLLREAAGRNIPTAAVIIGWDNPSSYRLNGAPVGNVTCWSEIQKEELISGADWDPENVQISGIPSYDGYFRRTWLMPRDEYFRRHGLDPTRKLLSYACSFETFAPNFPNIAAIAELVNKNAFREPCQLLIRLHPNHFRPDTRFEQEANRVREYIKNMPHVHLVEPVSIGGGLGHYSGEDIDEKASMMAYSDVFLTVYSTMVVETAIHDRPIVSVCIDTPGGWNMPQYYSLPLTAIGEWPTHLRFRQAGAGRVAVNQEEILQHTDFYLEHPEADRENRHKFIVDECTFTDGRAGERTAKTIMKWLEEIMSNNL